MAAFRLGFVLMVCILLFLVNNAFSQFTFKKIQELESFGFEKPLAFYSNPHYNRVEGLFLNFGLKYTPLHIEKFQIYGEAGWGFDNQPHKQFRYIAGIRKDFFDIKRLTVGAEVFRRVESEDDWVISDVENSLAALFIREDFKDYYGTEGVRFFIDHKLGGQHILRFELSRITYDALKKNTNFSIFRFNEAFEENPARNNAIIAEGDEISFKFMVALDWRDNPIFPLQGWYIEGIYEHTEEDFDTEGVFLTIKRYQQMFGNQRFVIRTMLGSRQGSLFEQHIMELGGIGSLRGFDDKEFSGNRFFMLNFNYLFGGDILQKLPLKDAPLFKIFWPTLSMGIFLDTGWAWFTNPSDRLFEGFDQLQFDNLKTDIGLSILVLDGMFRLDIAKRTERSTDDFRITFRLFEKF